MPAARILEITSYPPPRAGWGVRVSFVRAHLAALGHECRVLNIGKGRAIPSPEYDGALGGPDYLRKVIRFIRRGYAVHSHINGDGGKGWWLALAALLLARLWNRESVLTFHAGPYQRLFPGERSRLSIPFLRLIFRLPRVIICNSPAVKERIQDYGVPAAKIHPIPAFSRQYLDYRPGELSRDLEAYLAAGVPVLFSYFFLRTEFFVPALLDALRKLAGRLPSMRVVLVGVDTLGADFQEMLRGAGLREHVWCAGDLDHDQFLTLLSRCHFYVRTPSKDGVCSSVLEALSLGIPVIASENGHRPSSVITVPAADGEALAAAVERAWDAYPEVRAAVVKPEIEDTVGQEAELLLALARGELAASDLQVSSGRIGR